METLNQKYARLRSELQEAYRGWLNSAQRPDAHTAEWFAYLTAKSRLMTAYTERTLLQSRLEA
ncbi:MAG: hypothetical protein JSR90_18525 [Proteobacteria bacterium]|nr:hypothetical protein [Pseudomonadota bacterium]